MIFDKRSPVYEQIIEMYKQKIVSGDFQPGQEIPSRRELATQLKVNPNTVQRAYKEMEGLDLIFTDGNSLSRITENQAKIQSLRQGILEDALLSFIDTVRTVGMEDEAVLQLVETRLKEVQPK
ncbi:GntR family transcriptional regulator [Trichococcus patagoniensis]|uniref:GntR family transcriptional regulator n=1 Tax=Trichococcus patagoniensis TaxID=382641 RepID=A0A2T5IJL0_9LACT|nr:GntR family transcriptional regulator [Trichococcus patagoniensis]PTQ84002.1 GntR family transcriptional regulator [Trichococcus patagoniensis]